MSGVASQYQFAFSDLGVLRSAAEIASTNDEYTSSVQAYPESVTFASWYWLVRHSPQVAYIELSLQFAASPKFFRGVPTEAA